MKQRKTRFAVVLLTLIISTCAAGCTLSENYSISNNEGANEINNLADDIVSSDSESSLENEKDEVANDMLSHINGIEATKQLRVAYSSGGGALPWTDVLYQSLQESADEADIIFDRVDANGKTQKAFDDIREMIKQEYDVICVYPAQVDEYEPILKEIQDAGITSVVFVQPIGDGSLFDVLITSDYYKQGQLAGRWLLENYEQTITKTKVDAAINVVVLNYDSETCHLQSGERTQGFIDEIAADDCLQINETIGCYNCQADAHEAVSRLLADGKTIDVIYATDDAMAVGAADAIELAGKRPGQDIIVIGIEGSEQAVAYLRDGKINCIVENEACLGPLLAEYVVKKSVGLETRKIIYAKEAAIDIEAYPLSDIWSEAYRYNKLGRGDSLTD